MALHVTLEDGPTVTRGDVRVTPRALRVAARLGPLAAEAVVPVAVRTERGGRRRHRLVLDPTWIVRLAWLGLGVWLAARNLRRRRHG